MKLLIFSVLLMFSGIWMSCWGWSMSPEWYAVAIQLSAIPMAFGGLFGGAFGVSLVIAEIERRKGGGE